MATHGDALQMSEILLAHTPSRCVERPGDVSEIQETFSRYERLICVDAVEERHGRIFALQGVVIHVGHPLVFLQRLLNRLKDMFPMHKIKARRSDVRPFHNCRRHTCGVQTPDDVYLPGNHRHPPVATATILSSKKSPSHTPCASTALLL